MVNVIDEDAWNSGADMTDQAREAWETRTFAAHQAQAVSGNASVTVDQYLAETTEQLRVAWYDLIGNLGARLGSDVSKMRATAKNYSDTEDEAIAASERFWETT